MQSPDIINEAEIARELLLDHIERARQCFHLIKFVPIAPKPIDKLPFIVTTVNTKQFGVEDKEAATRLLFRSFSLLHLILSEKSCKIVAAGGAIAKAFWSEPTDRLDCDVDLFIVADANFDATAMLLMLLSKLKEECACYDAKLIIMHNTNTITVFRTSANSPQEVEKYQFILRIYPTIGHVLGGFDIPASAVCICSDNNGDIGFNIDHSSDGTNCSVKRKSVNYTYNYYATRLGAWSCNNRIIIADTTRRSTSYEARLQKYAQYCRIIIPGLAAADFGNHIKSARTLFESEQGAYCSNFNVVAMVCRNYYDYFRYTPEIGTAVKEIADLAKHYNIEVRIKLPNLVKVTRDTEIEIEMHNHINKVAQWYGFLYGVRAASNTMTFSYEHFHLYIDDDGVQFAAAGSFISDYGEVKIEKYQIIQPILAQSKVNRKLARLGRWDAVSVMLETTPTEVIGVKIPWICTTFMEYFIYNLNYALDYLGLAALPIPGLKPNQEDDMFAVDKKRPGKMKYIHLIKLNNHHLQSLFGENADYAHALLRKIITPESAPVVVKLLREFERITNEGLATKVEKLKSRPITWLRENPGRQWTALFNPVFECPADWYRPAVLTRVDPKIGSKRPPLPKFTPFREICPEYGRLYSLERELWRLRVREPFRYVPLDVYKYIIMIVLIGECQ